jgi:Carboxypeptidase regulatory-like domain
MTVRGGNCAGEFLMRSGSMKNVLMAVALVVGIVSTAHAQLHGMGRIQGTVVDESGAVLTDVTVKATLPGTSGSIDGTTDKKGEWALGGMHRGDWEVVFEKAGYVPRKAKVSLEIELSRIPPIAVTMKKQ